MARQIAAHDGARVVVDGEDGVAGCTGEAVAAAAEGGHDGEADLHAEGPLAFALVSAVAVVGDFAAAVFFAELELACCGGGGDERGGCEEEGG